MHRTTLTTQSTLAALSVGALLLLGACGTAETGPQPQPQPAPQGPSLAVTVEGDQVSPNAESIELSTGEELAVTVDSDRAGELHVHAKPEQYVDFDAGTTETTLVVETPGSVEIEDHDTGDVVALLEVR